MENVSITFRTKEDIKKELDMIAQEQNRTLSNLVETIVLRFLEEYENNEVENKEHNELN